MYTYIHIYTLATKGGWMNQYPPPRPLLNTTHRPRGMQEGRINRYPSHIPRGPSPYDHEGCRRAG
ncbi:hypothetical protein RR46_06760 [Papilio xuthus]|uniref:Uncharacterized protein n=1 Tax=Papilio xuthus TaxID=66420 RepID=A0A194PRE8_PAPXU|nr:hypothetical protein RR46_06760 [Papilio xuthus]